MKRWFDEGLPTTEHYNGSYQTFCCSERLFGPSVLFHDLGFFFGGEIVLNIEELTNFLDALTLDERGDLGARELKKRLDVKVVSSHDNLKEHLLIDVDKICVPLVDDLGHVG